MIIICIDPKKFTARKYVDKIIVINMENDLYNIAAHT